MDDLLTPVSTTYLRARKQQDEEPFLAEAKPTKAPVPPAQSKNINSADDALDSLKSQPDYDSLVQVLRFLTQSPAFHVHLPSPKSAAIVQTLVTEIAPNYWTLLSDQGASGDVHDGSGDMGLFVECLRSVTGVNALVSHLRALVQESRALGKDSKRSDISLNTSIFLDLLATLLKGESAIRDLWTASISELPSQALKKVQSHALLSILASGKLVSATGEAADIIGVENLRDGSQWVVEGLLVSKWIGGNIVSWAREKPTEAERQFCTDLFQRAMSLGYSDSLIKVAIDRLVLSREGDPEQFAQICLSSSSQGGKVLNIMLDHISDKFLDRLDLGDAANNATMSAVAGVIGSVTKANQARKNDLVKWCTSASGAGLGRGIGIRRAVVAVLAQDKDTITDVLEKSLAQFGDELYIKHVPVLQQNVHAEILLLCAGYVYRLSPVRLTMLLRSGAYLGAISNRIASTQSSKRFLGMVVGESLSALVDSSDKKLSFKMDEMDTDEADRLKDLTKVSDSPASVEPLISDTVYDIQPSSQPKKPKKPTRRKPQRKAPEPASETKPRAIIEELGTSDSDDDDDLAPYAKGSDPEDSDEDPTLVQRTKLRPPVYIRDLIAFFRDSESYDKQKLALQTAPVLIRRKANYGTEVSLHAEEIAGILVGIQDKFEIEAFDDMRLQSMISLVVAQPKSMAPWFARTFFEGDYSLSQRTSVLVTLGLAARELAGFERSENQSAADFASKRLPEKMERLYLESQSQPHTNSASQLKAMPQTALESISKSLTSTFLEPLAAEAADANTGPNALKLESFTARYKSRSAKKPRVRAIPNTTAALLSTSFFSPLTAHFQVALRSPRPPVLNPVLLGLYLQTVGIIAHAAGPSTLSLPQMTSELWDLLLGTRQQALNDLSAMKGWLVGMAALLEVNEGDMRRLCETQGREVVETREWVSGVFERTRGEDGGEENNVKMLAAGVLIRLGEAIERYQALLMGDMIGI